MTTPQSNDGQGEAFSAAAPSYDRDFSALPHVRELREKVFRIAQDVFPHGCRILDIGCGTGEDALRFSRAGFAVTATDTSPEMLRLTAAKTAGESMPVTVRLLDANDLSPLADGSFDGLFSNFGPLNCVEDLSRFFRHAHRALSPRGIIVICLLGRWSPWEIAGFLLRGNATAAFRRFAPSPVIVEVSGHRVPTWYHSAATVVRDARPHFSLVHSQGLNFMSPPPSSRTFADSSPRLSAILRRLEQAIGHIGPFSRMGDHVVFVFRKTP